MWFKGLFVLYQTVSLIAQANAASQGQDGEVGKQNHRPRALSYGLLHQVRQAAPHHGGNHTTSPEEKTGPLGQRPITPIVVVPSTNVEPTTTGHGPPHGPPPVQSSSSLSSSTTTSPSTQSSIQTTPSSSTPSPSPTPTTPTPTTPTPTTPTPTTPTPTTPTPTTPTSTTPTSTMPTSTTPTSTTPTPTTPTPTTPTPTPATPNPASPTPITPTPDTPTPATPNPPSPTPVSPTPVSPTPVSPTSVSPTPVSPTPISPTPNSPTPISPIPNSPTPNSPTPNSPTPATPTPILTPTETPVVEPTGGIPTSESHKDATTQIGNTSPHLTPSEGAITTNSTNPDATPTTANDPTKPTTNEPSDLSNDPASPVPPATPESPTKTQSPTKGPLLSTTTPVVLPSDPPVISPLPPIDSSSQTTHTTAAGTTPLQPQESPTTGEPKTDSPLVTPTTDVVQSPITPNEQSPTPTVQPTDQISTQKTIVSETGLKSASTALNPTTSAGVITVSPETPLPTPNLPSGDQSDVNNGTTSVGGDSTPTPPGISIGLPSPTIDIPNGLTPTPGLDTTTTPTGSSALASGETPVVKTPSPITPGIPLNPTDPPLVATSGVGSLLSITPPLLSIATGVPTSETLLTSLSPLPTLTPSGLPSPLDGISIPGASGTGNTIDTTNIPSQTPTLVNTPLTPTTLISTTKDATQSPSVPTTNVVPTGPSKNTTLDVPTPSEGSILTGSKTNSFTSTSAMGIPTTEDGPKKTFTPLPGSIPGATNTTAIATSGTFSPVNTGVTNSPIGTITGNEKKPTPIQTSSRIPASETNIATDPEKDDKPKENSSSVFKPTSTQLVGTSPQPSATPTPTSSSDDNSVTSDATFGTYMSTPSGYVPGSTTEPLVAFPTGPSTGKDGEIPPPPLTKQQTAGIAIGGTLSLLTALVAALFIARRYHAGKRNSTGSVYPELAYLYDPPVGGNGDAEAGDGVPTMSGGNGGHVAAAALGRSPSNRHTVDYSTLPQNSPSYPPTGLATPRRPASAHLAQSPFGDPEVHIQQATPNASPNAAANQTPFQDPNQNTAKLSALLIKPYAQNPAASEYPPMSPYESGFGSAVSDDPSTDPFEHDNTDLPLNVELGTETEDSIVVTATPRLAHSAFVDHYVPSPTAEVINYYVPPAPSASHFPGRDSRCNSFIPGTYDDEEHYIPERRMSVTLPPVAPFGRLSLAFSSTPSLHMTSQQYGRTSPESLTSSVPSSRTTVSPEPRGWDEIMNDPVPVPAPLNVTITRKPLPQRSEPPLAGPGQAMVATPLVIRKQPAGSATLAVPPSPYGPVPSKTETMSDDPAVQRKRSGELLFADPHLIGRPF